MGSCCQCMSPIVALSGRRGSRGLILRRHGVFNRRAHLDTAPLYRPDARDTIHLRVASWEDSRREPLDGKAQMSRTASALASNPFHRKGDP